MTDSMAYSQYYLASFPSDDFYRDRGQAIRATATERKCLLRMSALEEMIAEKAFARNKGLPDPFAKNDRESLVGELDSLYRKFELSTGRNVTEELVRRFENHIAQQAPGVEL
jgi:hypothetical protein